METTLIKNGAYLRRFWFKFENHPNSPLGYGVTAWTEEDAKAILQSQVFFGAPVPKAYIRVDIDVSTLDAGHIPEHGSAQLAGHLVSPWLGRSDGEEMTNNVECPCCKFKTLSKRGNDEICEVCFWQDDGQSEADAEVVFGGPNHNLSLRQAQMNFKRIGAIEERFLHNV
jgi:hypothetical protein